MRDGCPRVASRSHSLPNRGINLWKKCVWHVFSTLFLLYFLLPFSNKALLSRADDAGGELLFHLRKFMDQRVRTYRAQINRPPYSNFQRSSRFFQGRVKMDSWKNHSNTIKHFRYFQFYAYEMMCDFRNFPFPFFVMVDCFCSAIPIDLSFFSKKYVSPTFFRPPAKPHWRDLPHALKEPRGRAIK